MSEVEKRTRRGILGAHESLAVEVMNGIFCVSGAFKLDKTKPCHDTTVDDATIAVEEF